MLFFNFVGFELPNAAGDEMKDPQKDVPFTVLRAAISSVVLYGVPILRSSWSCRPTRSPAWAASSTP